MVVTDRKKVEVCVEERVSEGDESVSIELVDDDQLWASFYRETTEMIVTKPGR